MKSWNDMPSHLDRDVVVGRGQNTRARSGWGTEPLALGTGVSRTQEPGSFWSPGLGHPSTRHPRQSRGLLGQWDAGALWRWAPQSGVTSPSFINALSKRSYRNRILSANIKSGSAQTTSPSRRTLVVRWRALVSSVFTTDWAPSATHLRPFSAINYIFALKRQFSIWILFERPHSQLRHLHSPRPLHLNYSANI